MTRVGSYTRMGKKGAVRVREHNRIDRPSSKCVGINFNTPKGRRFIRYQMTGR